MKRIYLDNAATTVIDNRVAKAMRDFELEYFGNPNSIHREGQDARAKIDFARADIARFFAAKPQEIIFSSGATESNNHAIQGIVSWAINDLKIKPHVITTEMEHSSVYNQIKYLEKQGIVDATFVKPNKEGVISADDVMKEVHENTILVSCIFVSNEIGTVQPVREIGKRLQDLQPVTHNLKPIFHIDAVQAVKFNNCNVEKLGVDLLSFSAHKINGPKGIGGLYIKSGTKIGNLMLGGSQEYDKRPGTQNTTGIIGMAEAYKNLGLLEQRQKTGAKILKLKSILKKGLLNNPKAELNGSLSDDLMSPDILSVTIKDTDQETLITSLDLAGIAASTGSACVSGSTQASHVIKAIRNDINNASTLRLSLSAKTTLTEINSVIKIINNLL